MTDFDISPPQKILTVSELNRLARDTLTLHFPLFWVSGEVSNFTKAASGHWYFTLKDAGAQVRCVMFKGRNSYVDFLPREGDKIEARATVTLYEARGEFQLTVEFIQKAGLGALFEAFEKLKAKLSHEGLFDPAFKKTIPPNPSTIGIVTSSEAAALSDVLSTLKRRNPMVKVIIYPTPVQGKGTAQLIAQAIHHANQRAEVDTLIVCRGGGSLEDLWQFNEEVVARAIDDSAIPIISGVGHETDFTICDFVADLRAATPTAAAELACQDVSSMQLKFKQLSHQLSQLIELSLYQFGQQLDYLTSKLSSPAQKITHQQTQLQQLNHRLTLNFQQFTHNQQQTLRRLESNLQQLNPKNVLARGYAMVQNIDGKIITESQQTAVGDSLKITLSHGEIETNVLKIFNKSE